MAEPLLRTGRDRASERAPLVGRSVGRGGVRDVDGAGWNGPWFLLFPVFWVVVLFTAFWLFRRRGPQWHRTSSAEDVLAERYVRGEITADKYRQRLGVLQRKGG